MSVCVCEGPESKCFWDAEVCHLLSKLKNETTDVDISALQIIFQANHTASTRGGVHSGVGCSGVGR